MKYDVQLCEVLRRVQTAENTFDYTVLVPKLAEVAQPGQFAHIYVPGKTLRRPISICDIDKKNGTLRFVFQIRGAGTEQLSKFEVGDKMDILAPLGHGFTFDPNAHNLFIGGGIGVPPMLELAKELDCEKTIVLGYRDELFLNKEFEQYGKVVIATEDGSCGTKGNVLDAIRAESVDGQVIYSCGPTPMLRALKQYAADKGIEAWISLEEKMACGIGACLACVCKSKDVDHHTNVHNKRICKDGPVFNAQEVEL